MKTATLMAMIGRDQGTPAELRHGLAEALVRRLVRDELRRLLLRKLGPQGFGVFARGEPHDDVVPPVARADQEGAAGGVVIHIGDVGERDTRLAGQRETAARTLENQCAMVQHELALAREAEGVVERLV